MGDGLSLFLTAAALIIGVMLLIGKGGIFMRGGDTQMRKKLYDEKKMEKAAGVAMVALGAATGIDMFTTGLVAKIGYIVVVILIFAGYVYYFKTKCKKQ